MTTVYSARWVLPVTADPVSEGAIGIAGTEIVALGRRVDLIEQFPDAAVRDFGDAVILPGLVNTHSHLELTAMRGFLDAQESDFFAWLQKLTLARSERMTLDDLYVSAAWGACEAARAGVTCVGDASDAAGQCVKALGDVGLRGTVYQESFGPDPQLANENLQMLVSKIAALRQSETALVRVGVSPHAPYTVCASQLEMIADFARAERLPLMMHAAESVFEDQLIREGRGLFAERLAKRGIQWRAPGTSTVQYLESHGVLGPNTLLAHCINVDDRDIESIMKSGASIAHCPKSNAKLGHGRAPFQKFLESGVAVGLGSDSVASNNTCDILEEARFATLLARAARGVEPDGAATEQLSATPRGMPGAADSLCAATLGGARALGLSGEVGELRAGLQADLTVVSLGGAQQLPVYDPVSTLVFASSGRDVIMTVVAGREVYRDGRVQTVDEERLRARMIEVSRKIQT